MRSILLLVPVFLLAGCHDWDKDFASCQASGRCTGGSPDSGEFSSLVWSPATAVVGAPGAFGDVPVMGVGYLRFKLRNTGETTLTNLRIRFATVGTEPDFSLPELGNTGHLCDSTEFPFGELSCVIQVNFTPTQAQARTTRLLAITDQGQTSLLLTGRGVASEYSVTVVSNTAQRVSISYVDRFGPVRRDCDELACAYALLGPGTVTADVTEVGQQRLVNWGGDCAAVVGDTCPLTLSTSKKSLDVRAFFGAPVQTIVEPSNATASLNTVAPERSCSGDCTNGALIGTTLLINAVPTGDWLFAGFEGCTSSTPGSTTCQLNVTDAGAVLTGHFVPRLRSFITSGVASPIGALPSTLDAFCRTHALTAGLVQPDGGEYGWMAWVADKSTLPVDRLPGRGWVRVDGRPFFDSNPVNDRYPPVLDEAGNDLRLVDGGMRVLGIGLPQMGCQSPGDTWLPGEASSHFPIWQADFTAPQVSCAEPGHVICLQRPTSGTVLRPEDPLDGGSRKRVFVTRERVRADVGLFKLDQACVAESTPNFVAVGEDLQVSLSSLVQGSYVRMDNVELAPGANGLLSAPILYAFDGGIPDPESVWTGEAGLNCGKWQLDAGNAAIGSAYRSSRGWKQETTQPCDGLARLYCVEK